MSTDETRLFLEAKAKLQAQETQPAAPPSSKRGKAKSETPSVAPVQERVPVAVSAPAPHVAHAQAQEGQQAIPIPQPLLAVDAIREGLRAELDALRQERGVMQASFEAIRTAFQAQQDALIEQKEEMRQLVHLLTEAIQVQTQAVVCAAHEESQNVEQEQNDELLPPALSFTLDDQEMVEQVYPAQDHTQEDGEGEEQQFSYQAFGVREPEPILLGAGRGTAVPLPAPVRQRRWELA